MKTKTISRFRFLAILLLVAVVCTIPVYARQDSTTSARKEPIPTGSSRFSTGAYEENLKRWQALTEQERTMLRETARKLDPEHLEVLRERRTTFNAMPEEEQDRIRANFRVFASLSSEERTILEERYRRFIGLSPEKQEELRHRFRNGAEKPADVSGGKPVGGVSGGTTVNESAGGLNTDHAANPTGEPMNIPGSRSGGKPDTDTSGGSGSDGGVGSGGGGNGGGRNGGKPF